mgnify:CR=1 FL=1
MIFTGKNSGYDIEFDTFLEKYRLLDGVAVLKESSDLETINRFIENLGKEKKKKYKSVPVFSMAYYSSEILKGEATSIADTNHKDTYYWAVLEKKRRRENRLYVDNPFNRYIVELIKVEQERMKQAREEIDLLMKELLKLEPHMLLLETEANNARS